MLELVTVFHQCGLELWSRAISDGSNMIEARSLVAALISEILLADRAALKRFERGPYTLKWTMDNEKELVFVACYLNMTSLMYVDNLLIKLKSKFPPIDTDQHAIVDFDHVYDRVLYRFEDGAEKKMPNKFSKREKKIESNEISLKESIEISLKDTSDNDKTHEPSADIQAARQKLAKRGTRGRGRHRGSKSVNRSEKIHSAEPINTTDLRLKRHWNSKPTAEDIAALEANPQSLKDSVGTNQVTVEEYDSEYESDDIDEAKKSDEPSLASGVFGFFKSLVGKNLNRADLEPVLAGVKNTLLVKNVSSDIADEICESVLKSLVGKNLSSLQVKNTVKKTMLDTLTRILTPKIDIDLMRGVAKAKSLKRPFTIVFVGVNGVGKSTSLAKICYYLMTKKLKVMLAACDTFRAGAVEQLRTHANALGVDVFHKGYNKDPSAVAYDAIQQASRTEHDVVLIDTAGRMQDNEPLMRSLAKLIQLNTPDLVLFVGEALVGNDGVDQLTKFNSALADLSSQEVPRTIDAIVLTKFDTIDDKVGAAISMTYIASIPILFVGVGQDYKDLRRMNASALVKKLMK